MFIHTSPFYKSSLYKFYPSCYSNHNQAISYSVISKTKTSQPHLNSSHFCSYFLLSCKMEKSESTKIDVVETNKERKGKAPLLGTAAPVVAAAATAEHAKGGAKRGIAIFGLILRIAAFASALGAAVAMGTTEETLPFFTQFFQFEASYDDLPTFTFFVVAMAIVVVYLVLSVPFSIVCIVRPYATVSRLLLIIFDTVIIALATGAAGSAAAIVYLAHNGNQDANWLAICQQFGDFCQRASGAVVAAFITVVILIFMVVLSASALRRH